MYQQGGQCYNIEVSESSRITDADNATTFFSATTSTPASNDVGVACYCVTWLREVKGYNVKGNADTIQPNTDVPIATGVVLLDYDGLRHVAGIKYIMLDRILIEESNFEKCTPTERVLMLDDEHIVGFYYKNPN